MTDSPLRQRAQAQWVTDHQQEAARELSPEASRAMMHELEVHQIELEMQNAELRESQLALESVKARYFDLCDLAPVGYVTVSEAGLIVESNLTASTMLGLSRSGLIKKALHGFIAQDYQDSWYLLQKRVRETHEQCETEIVIVRGDGTRAWVRFGAVSARDELGAVTTRVVITNIDAHKQTQARLHDSNLIRRSIADAVPGMLALWDVDLKCVFSNGAYLSYFGRTEVEMQGIAMQTLMGEAQFRQNEPFVRAALSGVEQCFERTLTKANGEISYTWTQYIPQSKDKAVQGLLALVTDISEIKKDQLALQHSLSEKESLLKEVHHRVKNNLQVITSLLRMESRRSTVPAAVEVLKTMQGRIYAMAQLHESLYQSGAFASVDLGKYLGLLANQTFAAQAINPELLRLKINMGSVLVGMDQATVAGLLLNELISNCLKHAYPDRRSGEIGVELQPALDKDQPTGDKWWLRVSDSGVGLPANFEERRKTSLGLQLAGDLSDQLGGALSIDSLPGQGTRCSVTFAVLAPAALLPA